MRLRSIHITQRGLNIKKEASSEVEFEKIFKGIGVGVEFEEIENREQILDKAERYEQNVEKMVEDTQEVERMIEDTVGENVMTEMENNLNQVEREIEDVLR